MRRWWPAAALTALIGASGCGTILNVTDYDDKGRERYGGYHRDLDFFLGGKSSEFPSAEHPLLPNGGGKGALFVLALIPVVCVAYLGIAATETSLSLVGDTATAPILPVIDRVLGYDALPSIRRGGAAPIVTMLAPTPTAAEEPATEEQKAEEPPDKLPPLPVLTPPPVLGLKRYFDAETPAESPMLPLQPVLGLKCYFGTEPPKPDAVPNIATLMP